MQIQLNGKSCQVAEDMSLRDLVVHLGLDPKSVAIERNLDIVPRSLHGETLLEEGDRIELVEFVGGG